MKLMVAWLSGTNILVRRVWWSDDTQVVLTRKQNRRIVPQKKEAGTRYGTQNHASVIHSNVPKTMFPQPLRWRFWINQVTTNELAHHRWYTSFKFDDYKKWGRKLKPNRKASCRRWGKDYVSSFKHLTFAIVDTHIDIGYIPLFFFENILPSSSWYV